MTPRSIPAGLRVELSRARVRPGMSGEADRWMRMLNDRLEECLATLDRERMAIEIVFRLREEGEDELFWVSIQGVDGAGPDPDDDLDHAHAEFAARVKEPGWVDAEPQLLLMAEPVARAVEAWAVRPAEYPREP